MSEQKLDQILNVVIDLQSELRQFKEEVYDFKKEMYEFKDEMYDFKKDYLSFRKDLVDRVERLDSGLDLLALKLWDNEKELVFMKNVASLR